MKNDYKELGLKVGLEVHAQLNTKEKLFCSCKNVLEDEVIGEFFRKLRPTKSELGEIDEAALMEFMKGKLYVYQITPNSSCLVELDEEPPHMINQEAVEIAVACALLLNSEVVDEVHVMRKEVIDGSNTTGFQRTAIIALGGYLMDGEEKIGIQTITLEEDSCRKIKEEGNYIIYRLDRQGVPLIEIATSPNIKDPEQAKRVAYKIGLILSSTGKVRRILGSIRQDINLSIKNGAKTEIKGIQLLSMIPKVIEYEVQRQLRLLELKETLNSKNIPKPEPNYIIATGHFINTKSKIIQEGIQKGFNVFLLPLKGMKGLLKFELQPNRRFSSELADYVKAWTNLGGLISSDELPAYGISEEDLNRIYKEFKLGDDDAFILLVGNDEQCKKAIEVIVNRIKIAFEKVPEETRNAMQDGTTRFARARPGSARMYVETDIPPLTIKKEFIERIRKSLPLKIEDRIEILKKKYALSDQLARDIVDEQVEELFEKIVEIGVKPSIVASTLTQTLKYLHRSGLEIERLNERHFFSIFKAIKEGKLAKEAIESVVIEFSKNPDSSIDEIIKKLGLEMMSKEELKKVIEEIINSNMELLKSNKNRIFEYTMKLVMAKVRGKADPSMVSDLVKEYIKSIQF